MTWKSIAARPPDPEITDFVNDEEPWLGEHFHGGTMSEFELGLLRQRAQEALRQKISRSEVLTEVPIGYVGTETNGIEKTPDRQVQQAIAEVFLQFRRLGSVRQVLLWYRQEKVPLCSYRRDAHGRKCFGPCRVTTASWRFRRTRFTPVRLLTA